MELHANSSNNTVFADAEGNIAYLHANFIPKRNPKFDWSKPVDGSDPATEWGEALSVDSSPNVINPKSGWLYNTNNSPWSAAGSADSPKQNEYPNYVDTFPQNPRGINAIRLLTANREFTQDSLIAAAFDSRLAEMEVLVPTLLKAYGALPSSDPLKSELAEPIGVLKNWNYRWSSNSVATSLAVLWAEELWLQASTEPKRSSGSVYEYIEKHATAQQRLDAFATVTKQLATDFGSWKMPWGEINRFQRLTGDIVQPFADAAPSIPIPFTSARWGSLASFGARSYPGAKKIYGTTGNSFLAVVEFGDKVRARAITAGGQSGDPKSAHFSDQATRYARGELREVYFYPEQLQGHTERTYHPGE
jgi:acyl-homoserine-lactone acylase